MTSRNDVTGDKIQSKLGDHKKFSEGWDRIFCSHPSTIEETTEVGKVIICTSCHKTIRIEWNDSPS